ncbi:MAG: ROK family protein [candidate division Zixibacteria bacterium]|nr:ROK family protein [candidate division Zixibacteria bacterium]
MKTGNNSNGVSGESLGIDIGGSGIKAAPVDLTTGLLTSEPCYVAFSGKTSPEETKRIIEEIIAKFAWHETVGIGYPGVVKEGIALSAANISPRWLHTNLEKFFQPAVRNKIRVINDADAAGLAEMKYGSGKERNHPQGGTVLLLTLGTGIGSALFCHGRLFPNTEFGHVFLGNGLEGEVFAAASVRVRQQLSWEEWGGRLDYYLKEMEKLTSPDLIIIGGGIVENFDKFQSFLKTSAPVRPALMGNHAGIIGAALYAAP